MRSAPGVSEQARSGPYNLCGHGTASKDIDSKHPFISRLAPAQLATLPILVATMRMTIMLAHTANVYII